MTRPTGRGGVVSALRMISEAQWMQTVLDGFRCFGWRTYHTFDSRRSVAGFPDVVACHPDQHRVVFCELKSERGRLTPEQIDWGDALIAAGAEWYCLRPSSWTTLERVMRGERLC